MARGGRRSTSFKPGQSGNPGGRPKGIPSKPSEARKFIADVKQLAREYGKEAIDTLATIMQDGNAPPAARASAASVILDRGWGKAVQTVEAKLSILDQMTDEQQRALLSALSALPGDEDRAAGGTETAH